MFNIFLPQHHPHESEYIAYESSHEAIQAILKAVEGNFFAMYALGKLCNKIYEIVDNDDNPYKCRIYIQELDFAFCIGKIEHIHSELVINVTDKCRNYHWLNREKSWFKSWIEYFSEPPLEQTACS